MRRTKEDGPLFTQRPGFQRTRKPDMPNTDNEKYIPDVGHCLQQAGKILAHLPASALFTITAAMTLDFAVSHSKERSHVGASPIGERGESPEPLRKEAVYA